MGFTPACQGIYCIVFVHRRLEGELVLLQRKLQHSLGNISEMKNLIIRESGTDLQSSCKSYLKTSTSSCFFFSSWSEKDLAIKNDSALSFASATQCGKKNFTDIKLLEVNCECFHCWTTQTRRHEHALYLVDCAFNMLLGLHKPQQIN